MFDMRRTLMILSLSTIIVFLLTTASACFILHPATDPDSKTAGYKLFTGRTSGISISFEYPNTWTRYSDDGLVYLISKDSYIRIDSSTNKINGANTNANEDLQNWIDLWSTAPEFQIISRNEVRLGQAKGEEAIFSRVFQGSDTHAPAPPVQIGDTVIERTLEADYNGRIFFIDLLVQADIYDQVRGDFEHLIATFQYLN